MPIDITRDVLIPLNQVPDQPFIPRRRKGRKLHPATPYRWASVGLRGQRLETIQYAGTKCTSLRALVEFFRRLSRQGEVESPSQGDSLIGEENIEHRLDVLGI